MEVEVLHDVAVSSNLARRNSGQACAYAMIEQMDDGRLFCAYRSGTTKHSYDGKLLCQESADQGRSWSKPRVILDRMNLSPPESLISFQTVAANDGSLLVVFSVAIVTAPDSYLFDNEGQEQQRRCYKMHSYDGGQSWTKPQAIDYFNGSIPHGIVGKSFVLGNGEIFFNSGYKRKNGPRVITGSFSADNGKTMSEPIDLIWDPHGKVAYDDPYYAVFADGEAVGLFWTYQEDSEDTIDVHRCSSTDNGRSWSAPEPVGMLGQISVPLVLDENRLLVASNFRQDPQGLRVWISHDRGITFDKERPIQMWDPTSDRILAEPVQPQARSLKNQGVWDALAIFTFGTPGLTHLGDGTILLSYYATIEDVIHIRACRFRLK